jgi:hypothetical protein
MQEPNPKGPRPVDLLIGLFALLVNIVVAAAVVVWDSIRRAFARGDP